MSDYYLEIRTLHIACVLLSGSVFTFRGVMMLLGSAVSRHVLLKRFSYINDSVLLLAGLLLIAITQQSPLSQAWLGLKLLLLPLYIILGVFALRLGRTQRQRGVFFLGAVAVYLMMLSVAVARDPLGLLRGFVS